MILSRLLDRLSLPTLIPWHHNDTSYNVAHPRWRPSTMHPQNYSRTILSLPYNLQGRASLSRGNEQGKRRISRFTRLLSRCKFTRSSHASGSTMRSSLRLLSGAENAQIRCHTWGLLRYKASIAAFPTVERKFCLKRLVLDGNICLVHIHACISWPKSMIKIYRKRPYLNLSFHLNYYKK